MYPILTITELINQGFIIPNSNQESVIERANLVIKNTERDAIETILGVEMTAVFYDEFTQNIDRALILWDGGVIDNVRYLGLKFSVSNLIFSKLVIDRVVNLTASGVMASVSDNSEMVNPNSLINLYYNNWIKGRVEVYYFLDNTESWEVLWSPANFLLLNNRSNFNF